MAGDVKNIIYGGNYIEQQMVGTLYLIGTQNVVQQVMPIADEQGTPSEDLKREVAEQGGRDMEQGRMCEADMFRFIHPSVVDDGQRWKITQEIRNLVSHFPMQEICCYLMEMRDKGLIYLNVKPELALRELQRMGMPDEKTEGFSYKTFTKYYNVR